jgi:hypothetical protein
LKTCRRALLAATLLPRTLAAQPDPRPGFAALRLGVNLERWFTIAADARARRLGRGWWEGLRAQGFDHARLFIPKEAGQGEAVPRLFLDAIADATSAGMAVLIAMADTYDANEPWDAAMLAEVERRARLFGAETDPRRVALAALNEPAFPSPEAWTPVRDRLLGLMRAAAPRHALMWGGHEWCSWRSLLQQQPPADPLTIAEVHDYQGGDAGWAARRFGDCAAWGRRHRVPVMVTELGGAMPHATDEAAWAADLGRALPALRQLGLPATLWAVTHGGHWRLQQGDGPALRPALAAAIRR